MTKRIDIYDSTLRDGNQGIGITYSLKDKLLIAKKLDQIGVPYIEGGWPNPTNTTDMEFYREVRKLKLKNSKIAAFGSTRRPNITPESDAGLSMLIQSRADVFTIFGKSWDLHVLEVIKTSLDENLKMIESSVAYLKKHAEEVIYDAEHFFDGYKNNPTYAIKTIEAAISGGAKTIVLCDTNGGCLPFEFEKIFKATKKRFSNVVWGLHTHNDAGCADANTLIGVKLGSTHVQGTFNGIGERCGNANLCTIIPNLELKLKKLTIGKQNLRKLTTAAKYINAISNVHSIRRQPYVGEAAFSHKGGTHINGVMKVKESFEHIAPEEVGNERTLILSDQAGSSTVVEKLKKFIPNVNRKDPIVGELLGKIKDMETQGYQFEAAEGSFRLLAYRMLNLYTEPFNVIGLRVIEEKAKDGTMNSEATIKIEAGGAVEHTAADGNGPVNALDKAVRKALTKFYPELATIRLLDYKVIVIKGSAGTGAKVRVLIHYSDGKDSWGCVGVSENIIEASWKAMMDGINYKLCKSSLPFEYKALLAGPPLLSGASCSQSDHKSSLQLAQ
ncbi:MAG: citramalate synthase [Bacteriovoracaceae bacterium]|nr:citramalate synthase [Bacteriovoracaceae bacterium]